LTAGGKRVLVVGGAKGIGLATSRALKAQGYELAVWDNDTQALDRRAFECAQVDITDRGAVRDALAALRTRFAPLHAVVISAGVHATGPSEAMPDAVLDRVMDVNFLSHAKLVRDVLSLMAANGRIIGVSSIAATVGIPMSAAYSASKAALEAFYATLTSDLRHRRVWPVIVQPGNVNTGFNETGNSVPDGIDPALAGRYRSVVETIHSRHGMPPDDVAAVICQAVTAEPPSFLYVVGKNAQRANLAKRILGYNGALYFLRRHFGFT
jgi:NAD(P)-dependent dehydrogenase (short-subunit alcohol dehydrogenase family)